MSEAKFTKGPWRLNKQFDTFLCVDSQCHSMVCDIDCDTDHNTGLIFPNKEQLANANLIAAAPEMYEMLECLSSQLTDINAHSAVNDIEKLLSKARGEA